jgi:hypothetical protein
MVCFGDGPLGDFRGGEHVFVMFANANGSLEGEFAATIREVAPAEIRDDVVSALVDHVSLGRSLTEVEESLARCRRRRLLMVVP